MTQMNENAEFEGKDLEEALAEAARDRGVAQAELHYEIVEQGRRGVLGLGVKNVRIRLIDALDAPEPGREDDIHEEGDPHHVASGAVVGAEVAAAVGATAQRMLDLMGLELSASAAPARAGVTLEIDGADRSALLDREGELLAALQLLLNRMARRSWPEARRVLVECDGHAGSLGRDDEIVRLAREVAQQVSRTGRTKKLHPLNSYERRLVHLTVREFSGLTSSSDGQGSRKRVRISKVRNTVA